LKAYIELSTEQAIFFGGGGGGGESKIGHNNKLAARQSSLTVMSEKVSSHLCDILPTGSGCYSVVFLLMTDSGCFQVVDMRWGVRDGATDTHAKNLEDLKYLDYIYCLDELFHRDDHKEGHLKVR